MSVLRIRRWLPWVVFACWALFAVWVESAPSAAIAMTSAAKLGLRGGQCCGCPFGANSQCIANAACAGASGHCPDGEVCPQAGVACGVDGNNNPNVSPVKTYTGAATACQQNVQVTTGCYTTAPNNLVYCVESVNCMCRQYTQHGLPVNYCTYEGVDKATSKWMPGCFTLQP